MSTVTAEPTTAPAPSAAEPKAPGDKGRRTGVMAGAVLVVWLAGWLVFRGTDTLARPFHQLNSFDTWLNKLRDRVATASQHNWFFHGVLGHFSSGVNWLVTQLGSLIAHPAGLRPVPEVGWVGVLALFAWAAYAVAGLRSAILVGVSVFLFAWMGLWADSMDLLIVTALAVAASILLGVPVGILMARSNRVSAILTPVLDAMQTMPSFCYLLPFFMLFGPGATCAIVLTAVYSLPPLVRITEHGIRSVAETTLEAARSLGVTRSQLLRQVQLPMARRTIVLGINQCTLAAISMAVIAGLVNGPGLGLDVISALASLNVGQAAVPGLLIVLMAIMLDRTATAASERSELRGRQVRPARGRFDPTLRRRIGLGAGLVVVVVAIYLSRTYVDLAQFPTGATAGSQVASGINDVTHAVVSHIDTVTLAFKNVISYGVLNPLQSVLATSPWWLTGSAILALAYVLGGLRPLAIAVVCEAVILLMGLWNDAMVTLTSTLVATALVMIQAIVLGVWMGRSRRADLLIRPVLDAFQTIPAFVYLVPALALFGSTRFTAIVAGVAYAAPIAVKLVADGILGVSASTVEGARSSGVTSWQMIRKVQLPMALPSIVLAANQGLLYVLSMVVIGAMVGAGSLGYLVVSGFSQDELFGKGLAAGIALTALGIMLDRIAKATAARQTR